MKRRPKRYTPEGDQSAGFVFLFTVCMVAGGVLFGGRMLPARAVEVRLQNDRATLEAYTDTRAALEGIDPRILDPKKQFLQESGWRWDAVSPAGAIGVAQIIPKYHRYINPWDPKASIDYAVALDAKLLKQYGTCERAMSAYNSGRPDAYKDPGFANGETTHYVKTICG
jgi:hypothetical protein